jgi:AcrR family transcriptional regulator
MSSSPIETRTKILEAALTLLEHGGGQNVRMADIARQAGLSRQAIYLHFADRADLLIAATRHFDEIKHSAERLAPSRRAATGIERLDAFIAAWTAYLPEVHGVARALLAMRDSDADAATAWKQRMEDMREGCAAAIEALHRDGNLNTAYSPKEATDILWMLLSVRSFEHLTIESGWTAHAYRAGMQGIAHNLFVAPRTGA